MSYLGIEDLPGELLRLLDDLPSVQHVRVVAEVGSFVHESLAVGVDHDPEGVAVLLEPVSHPEVAEFGRVEIPGDGVCSRPVAVRHGPDVESHPDPVPGVAPRAAHPRQIPALPEVLSAPGGVGLKPTSGENHGSGRDLADLSVPENAHTNHRPSVVEQIQSPRLIGDLRAFPLDSPKERFDQPGAPFHGLQRGATPEREPSVDLERLPPICRVEPHPLGL